jgi:catalase (peroxidase I)
VQGGCNGARIRLSPQKDWPSNVAMDKVLEVLAGVKAKFGASLTWADLIVLAGERRSIPMQPACLPASWPACLVT